MQTVSTSVPFAEVLQSSRAEREGDREREVSGEEATRKNSAEQERWPEDGQGWGIWVGFEEL